MADESKRMYKEETGNQKSTSLVQSFINTSQARKEIQAERKIIEESEKKILKLKAEQWRAQQRGEEALLAEKKKQEEQLIAQKVEAENRINDRKKKLEKENAEAWFNTVTDVGKKLKDNLDSTMKGYLEVQEAMAYNLNGTGTTLREVTSHINSVLAGTGVVNQQQLYTNFSNLIKSGIVYNAEQRAYLQTLSDDLGMAYNTNIGNLTRLINLQREDLSSNRMAIEYSLKEFLNQNYQTSQYIKEGFEGVSQALIEAQSLMASNTAMEFEAVVQQWMGSLSSVGMSSNTIQSLANAIGQLGAGDISGLSSNNMQNLLVMGASVAGKSYADLLTNGLTADTANELMQGIVSYIAGMANNTSNVVKSEYGRIFGLSVSDIIAASQVGNVTENGFINDNIGNLLGSMNNYLYAPKMVENLISNFMYSWATGIASDQSQYTLYRLSDILANVTAETLDGLSATTSVFGNGATFNLSALAKAAPLVPLITALPELLTTGINAAFNIGRGETDALSIYSKLAGNQAGMIIKNAGLLAQFSSQSGISQSGSSIIANTDESDILKATKTSATNKASKIFEQEEAKKDVNDVYNMLEEVKDVIVDLPLQPFGTITRIAEAANTVTIGNDITYLQDIMTVTAINIQNIYNVVSEWFMKSSNGAEAHVYNAAQLVNTPFTWAELPNSTASDVTY